ncbi:MULTISPECIES: helix-turn-helix transcriptional regulator [Shinella]|jgi:DNA-binding CsgD family transcriptional regulator|uniref:LuxR family transcriptional regulator n=1 Tax=Shinella granuli TaxID=323621 RepID=A0A4R2CX89_SHIGR|nr:MULTISPECIES: LuxR C-terminal-related transcriptional regulator [Shinella]ANH03365.1 DNA-binding protein [Shinella sp. HZN7]TCN45823.1 LuxR family transcriptional regulator [Shinella granuli]
MSISALSMVAPNALDEFCDLQSVPVHRHFGRNEIVDRFRRAVPFDYIIISGLDVEGYRFGKGHSIDTDLPPAFMESYAADALSKSDPFVIAAKTSRTMIAEKDVYAVSPPPARLAYLADLFGIHNRTLFPIKRSGVVYGAVCFTRNDAFEADELAFLEVIAEPIHTVVTRPLMERFAAQQLRLSKGEIACLAHASVGLTSEEIASVTEYQVDTVNTYIKAAVKKLGAANRSQAVAEAIRRRLID